MKRGLQATVISVMQAWLKNTDNKADKWKKISWKSELEDERFWKNFVGKILLKNKNAPKECGFFVSLSSISVLTKKLPSGHLSLWVKVHGGEKRYPGFFERKAERFLGDFPLRIHASNTSSRFPSPMIFRQAVQLQGFTFFVSQPEIEEKEKKDIRKFSSIFMETDLPFHLLTHVDCWRILKSWRILTYPEMIRNSRIKLNIKLSKGEERWRVTQQSSDGPQRQISP